MWLGVVKFERCGWERFRVIGVVSVAGVAVIGMVWLYQLGKVYRFYKICIFDYSDIVGCIGFVELYCTGISGGFV